MALVLVFSSLPLAVFGQGSLTPPGAPAPTMKTLAQVEPRTPISSAPVTITNSGSYYLTTNLTVTSGDAITIGTNGVTLDLNGFTISSTAPSGNGFAIRVMDRLSNITIYNGHIRSSFTNDAGTYSGSGFDHGIAHWGNVADQPDNVRVSGVTVSGCRLSGICLGRKRSALVESCTVQSVGMYGIFAGTIRGSIAQDCGSIAINGDQISDCRGESTKAGPGIYGTMVQNSYGTSTNGTGIDAFIAINCYGSSITNYGLHASTAINCRGESISGTGLAADTVQNCIGISESGTGLYAGLNANNSYGSSTSGPRALFAMNASYCTAWRSTGRAIEATVATGCYATAGTNLINHKYNMP